MICMFAAEENSSSSCSSISASILYAVISLILPIFALLTINQEWRLYIDFLNLNYKPWRLFIVGCSVPNFFCALGLIFIIPESPKFTYSQGNEEKTLEIFKKIYTLNTGKHPDSFEVFSIVKNEEFGENCQKSSQGFFNFMWTQTLPLFKGSHLRNILTACFIQFAVCNTSNGFWTFLPEIMNKISLWYQNEKGPATVCEVFNSDYSGLLNETSLIQNCVQKLELSTYIHAFEVDLAFAVCYGAMSMVINKTGKLILILIIVITTGASAFSLIFVNIPMVALYLYLFMILAGLTISVVNASTVELFPTSMRFVQSLKGSKISEPLNGSIH
jgi:MFS transporter, VNT family, synaptic vesicle glycoprotein 2